jgi:glycosyltransferase involved in cell wall biosynthesis
MNILIVVDTLGWGSERTALKVAEMCGETHHFEVTDIKGLLKASFNEVDLVMSWLDTAEPDIYKYQRRHGFRFASRIAGWKGVFRTTRLPSKVHEQISGVVCCNPELQLASEKVYPKNVRTIMNGVDTDIFKPNLDGLGKDWVWIGRQNDDQKDYQLMERVREGTKQVIRLKTQKWKQGPGGPEMVPTDWPQEMVDFYQGAYGYLRTSRNEGSSNCLLEGMACGLPVVATPTGVSFRLMMPKYLCTSVNHIVHAMKEFKRNRQLAEDVGRWNRRQVVDGWQWQMRREPYTAFFESCMES